MGTQLAGVLLAVAFIFGLARRAGIRVSLPSSAAVTAIVFLTVVSTGALRESWHALDLQRSANDHLTADAARSANCTALGVDPAAVKWASGQMGLRARFYLAPGPALSPGADICLRFLLLPRLQVRAMSDAGYVLFWNARMSARLLSSLGSQGTPIVSFGGVYHVARIR
jgi:hypothetical protein